MKLKVVQGDITHAKADAIIVNLFEGVTHPGGGTGAVDKALGGLITSEIKRSSLFSGKKGQVQVIPTFGKLPSDYVVLVGLGKQDELNAAQLRNASATGIRACQKLKIKTVGTLLHGAGIGGYNVEEAARLVAEGSLLGNYQFTLRKSDKKESSVLETVTVYEIDSDKLPDIKLGLRLGELIAQNVNLARDWVNDSPNHVTPSFLKAQAEAIPGLACTVLDISALKKHKMGLFLSVTQGSEEPPYLIHLSYKPSKKPTKKIALVGKGLTFDSGGLSLKPSKSMETMKMDMAGAAAVLATMKAISEIGNLNIQVDGFIGTCENMPSGKASRPGDIVTAMSGKTVEISNTDAEGRLVLADVITYAQKQVDPDEMIDLATLTGACIVALGTAAAGIMGGQTGSRQDLIDELIDAGAHAGEKLWQLPFFEEYQKPVEGEWSDLINSNANGEAGSQHGGMFLNQFVDENLTWAHIDIAGPAMLSKDFPVTPKGATGFGVRTLLYYLYQLT